MPSWFSVLILYWFAVGDSVLTKTGVSAGILCGSIIWLGQLLCVCSVAWLCLPLCDPKDCSPPGSSIHGIFQTRILDWVAISSSRGSSWPSGRPEGSNPSLPRLLTRQESSLPLSQDLGSLLELKCNFSFGVFFELGENLSPLLSSCDEPCLRPSTVTEHKGNSWLLQGTDWLELK